MVATHVDDKICKEELGHVILREKQPGKLSVSSLLLLSLSRFLLLE